MRSLFIFIFFIAIGSARAQEPLNYDVETSFEEVQYMNHVAQSRAGHKSAGSFLFLSVRRQGVNSPCCFVPENTGYFESLKCRALVMIRKALFIFHQCFPNVQDRDKGLGIRRRRTTYLPAQIENVGLPPTALSFQAEHGSGDDEAP